MNKKLTYTKTADSLIEIQINDYYIVVVAPIWNKENSNYIANFYLKDKKTNILDFMEDFEGTVFDADYKTIYSSVLKYVAELLHDGKLKKYISRYKYMLKCFDKGDELLSCTEDDCR